jgi:hypothetical protein
MMLPTACCRLAAVEQRMEVPHAATRMGIHTLAHDPTQPYYFATGGEDSLGEWVADNRFPCLNCACPQATGCLSRTRGVAAPR